MDNRVRRTIYYYDLHFNLLKKAKEDGFSSQSIINIIFNKCDQNSRDRLIPRKANSENKHGIYSYRRVNGEDHVFFVKFVKVRNDVFPQLMDENMNIEDIEGIGKGVIETTHLLLDMRDPDKLSFAIEYNYEGAKASDFAIYLRELDTAVHLK